MGGDWSANFGLAFTLVHEMYHIQFASDDQDAANQLAAACVQ